jgi:hypothetical protein
MADSNRSRWRLVSASLLVVVGGLCIVYSIAGSSFSVQPQATDTQASGDDGATPADVPARVSEADLIKEVSVGGVTTNSTGGIDRTYTDKPPAQCPT